MILTNPIEIRTGSLWQGLSDRQLLDMCMGNKELKIERDEEGNLLIMSPTKARISHFNADFLIEMGIWNKKYKKGVLTDSNGGFILPDGSMRAPDLGFVLIERYKSLTEDEKDSFAPICPDFVAEIMSSKDELADAKKKMEMWMRNGCQIAWLVDTFSEKIYVYGQDGSVHIHDDFKKELKGTQFLSEFVFIPADIFSE